MLILWAQTVSKSVSCHHSKICRWQIWISKYIYNGWFGLVISSSIQIYQFFLIVWHTHGTQAPDGTFTGKIQIRNKTGTSIYVKQYVSEWLLFDAKWVIYQQYHWRSSGIWCAHAKMVFYTSSSLIQQSAGRHIAPMGHIILILSQAVFVFTQYSWVFTWEVTYTNYIFFGLTRLELEPTTYDTQDGLPLYHRGGSKSKAMAKTSTTRTTFKTRSKIFCPEG